jgi:hypothetical protein
MILFVTLLSLALLATLGCIGTLIYVVRKERQASGAITDVALLTKMYFDATSLALAESAVNSSDAYAHSSRTDRVTEISPARRQTYQAALASLG